MSFKPRPISNKAEQIMRARPDLIVVQLKKIYVPNDPDPSSLFKKIGTARTYRAGDDEDVYYDEVPIVWGSPSTALEGGWFYQGFDRRDNDKPFLILQPAANGSEEEDIFLDFPNTWVRFSDDFNGWMYKPEIDDELDDSTTMLIEDDYVVTEIPQRVACNIVRLHNTSTFWTNGGTLFENNEDGTTSAELDDEFDIVAMIADGGVPFSLIYGEDTSGVVTCEDAYDDAYDFVSNDIFAYQLGSDSCLFPETSTGTIEGDYLLYYESTLTVPPEFEDGDELETCWYDGAFDAFFEIFNIARVDEGCEEWDE